MQTASPFFRSYSDSLKARFGQKVYKVTVDAGFNCPNRDGSKGFGGCTFCDDTGSSSRAQDKRDSLTDQIRQNIEKMRARFKAHKFVVYFQPYTNTYAPLETLKAYYDEALAAHPDLVGLAISTRPDCVDAAKLDLLKGYQDQGHYISVEYGMQTIHDRTLEAVNRCESYADFLSAFEMTRARGLSTCVHVILGLPGETREEMIETAKALSLLKPEGVKIHLMCAMANTVLEIQYRRGQWQPFSQEDYVETVCDFLEHLDPEIALHRVSGNGHREGLVAPRWLLKKHEVRTQIEQTMMRRGTVQGAKLRTI